MNFGSTLTVDYEKIKGQQQQQTEVENYYKGWNGRKITRDHDETRTSKIILMSTAVIATIGFLLGGWMPAAAVAASGLILNKIVLDRAKVDRDTWFKNKCGAELEVIEENYEIYDHEEPTVALYLTSKNLYKNKKILCRHSSESSKDIKPFRCLVDINQSPENPENGEIYVYVPDTKYKDWKFAIEIDRQKVKMLNPIKEKL